MDNKKEVMLEVHRISNKKYKVFYCKDMKYMDGGYEIELRDDDVITKNKDTFFVKSTLCSLEEAKNVIEGNRPYGSYEIDLPIKSLKKNGIVGAIVNNIAGIPFYFVVHKGLIYNKKTQ